MHLCHISASGTGDYLRWNSMPYNPELNGHESDSLLDVTPNTVRKYSLYMAYSDNLLCSSDTTFYIPQIDVFRALISANPAIADFEHTTVMLADVSPDPADRVWYVDGSEISRSQKVEYDYPVTHDSIVVTLAASSIYGCHDTAQLTIPFMLDGIYVPNIITPSRGDNNYFQVFGSSLMDGEIWIFDRRGTQVWHSNDIHARWDATYEGKPLPQDAYVYTIRYRQIPEPDVLLRKTGTVTVIR
jgi:gliding motility-associated-like protein